MTHSFSIIFLMRKVSFENPVMSCVVSKVNVGKMYSVCSALAKQCSRNQSQTGKKGRGSLRVLSLSPLSSIFCFGKTGKAQSDTED